MKHVIVGTAGHIDHGKSALVEALTGTNPDRLEEEKRRGITIDLGFAFLERGGVRIGFVDVPGHERFVKNMLAGVGGIDLVLFVVAADESIKPQTREHFDICRLLEIPGGLIALTKADLVEPDVFGLVRLEVEEFVRGSFLEPAPMVPVSARTGAGLDALAAELFRIAAATPEKDSSRHFRLPIDRAFAMKGFGSVVTGTLVSGSVAGEDEVELLPAGRRLRVRGVQSGGHTVERAVAGQRTAINVAGIELSELKRGDVLAVPGLFEPGTQLDARITLLRSARRLKTRTRVHFHQGTAETVAEVVLLDREELGPGESAFAQLRLDDPVVVLLGDRFILRQFSPVVTIGGGAVLDPHAPRHRIRERGARLSLLGTLATGERAAILAAMVKAHRWGRELGWVLGRTGWLESEIREAAARLEKSGELRLLLGEPLLMVATESLEKAKQEIVDALDAFHKRSPLVEGIAREDLRARATPGAGARFFQAALDELSASKRIAVSGDLVKRAGREISLLPEEAQAREQIERAFQSAGLTVPPLKDVLSALPVESKRAQKLLQMLLREGVLVRVSAELVFHREALRELRGRLQAHKDKNGPQLKIAAFKDLAVISRKYAIPLLEYLDRERVTRREGDDRVIL